MFLQLILKLPIFCIPLLIKFRVRTVFLIPSHVVVHFCCWSYASNYPYEPLLSALGSYINVPPVQDNAVVWMFHVMLMKYSALADSEQ